MISFEELQSQYGITRDDLKSLGVSMLDIQGLPDIDISFLGDLASLSNISLESVVLEVQNKTETLFAGMMKHASAKVLGPAIGATLGSVVPVVGTVIGAVVGGLVSSLLGGLFSGGASKPDLTGKGIHYGDYLVYVPSEDNPYNLPAGVVVAGEAGGRRGRVVV